MTKGTFAFSVPYWLTRFIPGARRRFEELESRTGLTGTARTTQSRSWLGGGIEMGVTYELQDAPEAPPNRGVEP